LLCATWALAAANDAARVRAFARLPNWTGIWESTVWLSDASGRPPGGAAQVRATEQLWRDPPYNDEWAATYRAALSDTAAIAAKNAGGSWCLRTFPGLMEGPRPFQIAILPEETLIVFEGGQVRHVYTDGRAHPSADDLWPTDLGDSIGHWEGDTLVIDTIARLSTEPMVPGAWASLLSDRSHFIERFRMTDQNYLEDQMTIEDPVALARPWTMTLRFKRLRNLQRMLTYDCTENERNPVVDGKLIIAPPREQTKK
jgi:hypothetical protein